MSPGPDATDALEDAATVLVVAPDVRDAPTSACAGLANNGGPSFDRVVGVTVGQSPADWLDAWQRQAGSTSTSLTCVDVDSVTRSTSADTGFDRPAATLRTVSDPADLETLGEILTGIMTDADAVDDRVAVCIHSLSDVLGHVSQKQAFGFLCTLGERARERGAVVYAHLDDAAHDDSTAEVLGTVCDAVVEFDDSLSVQLR